jgi:hypothetical protein
MNLKLRSICVDKNINENKILGNLKQKFRT